MSDHITNEAIVADAKERLIEAIRHKDKCAVAGVLRERVLTEGGEK